MVIVKSNANGSTTVPIETSFYEQRILYLSGEISSESVLEIQKQLGYLAMKDASLPVLLVVSSLGGSVQAGLSLVSTINSLPFKVDSLVLDMAASMGAVISVCCSGSRYVGANAKLMLHEPLVRGIKEGSLSDIKETYEDLERCKQRICEHICKRTKQKEEIIKDALTSDHYYSAREAIDNKLADKIEDVTVFANYGCSQF